MSETVEQEVHDEHDPDAPVTVADKEREPTRYERELRAQAAKQRRRALDAERVAGEKIAAAERARDEAIAAAQRERDEKVAEVQRAAQDRLVRAELKAAAIKAGMVDPDGLKLLDLSDVTLDEKGELKMPEGFFDRAKEAKPFLFSGPVSTSNPGVPPKAEAPKPKRATEWTPEEVEAAKRRISSGQRLVA